ACSPLYFLLNALGEASGAGILENDMINEETAAQATETAFAWNDGYKLGYTPMDDTHEEFVEIVNAMLVCPESALLDNLNAFVKHAEAHFGEELEWMRATDFPNTDCHAEQHDAVMQSVLEVRDYLLEGGDPTEVR